MHLDRLKRLKTIYHSAHANSYSLHRTTLSLDRQPAMSVPRQRSAKLEKTFSIPQSHMSINGKTNHRPAVQAVAA